MTTKASTIAYWIGTLFVALTALGAGVADVFHLQPLYGVLLHLGYPPYFATLLGVGKIAGAIVLLTPRYALFKEWAYAAMACDYLAAIASHAASGDGAGAIVGPAVALAAMGVSWYFRPASRRLALA